MPASGLVDDVAEIAEIVFEDVECAEAVERLHRIISVADPAVAIVPVAAAVGRFRNRGGEGGDDGAGLLMLAELEGDGGTDDGALPFERDGEPTHPVPPMVRRLVEHRRQHLGDVADERLIGTEEEMKRLLQPEAAPLEQVNHRRIGGEP